MSQQHKFMAYERFHFNPKKHTVYIGKEDEPINAYHIHAPLLALIKRFCLGKMRIKYDGFYCLDFAVNIEQFYHPYLAHFDWICRAYNVPHQLLKDFDQELVNERTKLRAKQPQPMNIDDF
ncbi:hypothetical protein VB715_18625 [Crocosphaera sp. UHCC 0190]|uniref:hypothetical protein n=1 Tax=Crocosphaera sp. UHCC 0190 TaxID=3110246 RepID=UPI002B204DEE|nr:hypothetical protein [Crocosphaera sp. UHCC 0190]MEA5511791.1 hypothetical protein [Crocosphaera sp. UHCC 0190]